MMMHLGAALAGAATVLVSMSASINEANDVSAVQAAPGPTARPVEEELRPNAAAVRTALASLAEAEERHRPAKGPAVEGTASMYNPYRPGPYEGGKQTASGEPYDPNAWTAAIQMDLRESFGGVRYGRLYRPTYALVEGGDKQVIIKINDVGPLRPGRVIDFNEQTMRHFDPTLARGLIHGVKVTPLLGDDWPTGPIENDS